MKDVKKLAQEWWAEIDPIAKLFYLTKHFPNVVESDVKDNHIEYMYKKLK